MYYLFFILSIQCMSFCASVESSDYPETAVAGKYKGFFFEFMNKENQLDSDAFMYDDKQPEDECRVKSKILLESLGCRHIEDLTIEQFSKKYDKKAVLLMLNPQTNHLFSEELKKELESVAMCNEIFGKDFRLLSHDEAEPNIESYEKVFFVVDDETMHYIGISGAYKTEKAAIIAFRVQKYKALGAKKVEAFSWKEFYNKYPYTFLRHSCRKPDLFKLELLEIKKRTSDSEFITDLLSTGDFSDEKIEEFLSGFMAAHEKRGSMLRALSYSSECGAETPDPDALKRAARQKEAQRNAAEALLEKNKILEAQRREHEKAEAEKQKREELIAAVKQAKLEAKKQELAELACKAAEQKEKERQANKEMADKLIKQQKNKEEMNDQFAAVKIELSDMQKAKCNQLMQDALIKALSDLKKTEEELGKCRVKDFKEGTQLRFQTTLDDIKKNIDKLNKKNTSAAQHQDDDGDDACLPQLQQQEQSGFLQQELCEKQESSAVVIFGPAAPAQAGPVALNIKDKPNNWARLKPVTKLPKSWDDKP